MDKELLSCKHGLIKETCLYCKELDDAVVLSEKEISLSQKNWQSNSFFDNAAHNSSVGDQEYDIDDDFVDVDFDNDSE